MTRFWRWFLAYWRLDKRAVCEMSVGRNMFNDYHDYWDADPAIPTHFHILHCRRCGKPFVI